MSVEFKTTYEAISLDALNLHLNPCWPKNITHGVYKVETITGHEPLKKAVAFCLNEADAQRLANLLQADEDRQARQRQVWPDRAAAAGRRRHH